MEHATPLLRATPHDLRFSIGVTHPRHSVVMTPCCSIENKVVCLTPLLPIPPTFRFYENPYFLDDLTRLNRVMLPRQSTGSVVWETLLAEEQAKREAAGLAYAMLEWFVYAPNEQLPAYPWKGRDKVDRTLGHYIVDFRNSYKVVCPEVVRDQGITSAPKVLQLSVDIRHELRCKLSQYFGRVPDEDKPFLEP
jgi:hypothetical protein